MYRNNSQENKKYYLMLCELHCPEIHGKCENSNQNIETHYLVYDRFDPITGVSYSYLDEYEEYDTDDEYESDSDITDNFIKIDEQIRLLKQYYLNLYKNLPLLYGQLCIYMFFRRI